MHLVLVEQGGLRRIGRLGGGDVCWGFGSGGRRVVNSSRAWPVSYMVTRPLLLVTHLVASLIATCPVPHLMDLQVRTGTAVRKSMPTP